jgi:histidine phosphotransferase ChpT
MELKLSDLDLAALLCSRVCHDVISPVGAIANGLELMDDPETDAAMRATALDMVRSSAKTATAKLKFCRIAFGASGSAGAHIDLGEAAEVARDFVGNEKIKLDWQAPRENRPKAEVKLLLNMLLLAMAGIPRGGGHGRRPEPEGEGTGRASQAAASHGRHPAWCGALGNTRCKARSALLHQACFAIGFSCREHGDGWGRRCGGQRSLARQRRHLDEIQLHADDFIFARDAEL